MATISCHSNQSSYPIGTKTILFVPTAYTWQKFYSVTWKIQYFSENKQEPENSSISGKGRLNTKRMLTRWFYSIDLLNLYRKKNMGTPILYSHTLSCHLCHLLQP